MIYILESGEYSDYTYHAIIEGPDNLDFASMYDEVISEAKAMVSERYKEWAKGPHGASWQKALDKNDVRVSGVDTVAAWVRAIERRGGRELCYTAVHLGSNYGSMNISDLEVKEPTLGSSN